MDIKIRAKRLKMLIVAKSIDGGTGTYVLSIAKNKKLSRHRRLITKVAVLERPSYRRIKKDSFLFLRKKGYYPQEYKISLKSVVDYLEESLWIGKIIKNLNPDIILGVGVHCNLLIQINNLLSSKKPKTILTTHINLSKTLSDKSDKLLAYFLRLVISPIYRRADALVFDSKGLAKETDKKFRLEGKTSTIYLGIGTRISHRAKKINNGKKIIITVARLVEQKDHALLIKAFESVQKKLPDTELWIASDGPLKNELIRLSKKLGLSKKVKFLGWVRKLSFYLRRADVFVLSSKREGFGYVLVEAMTKGLPVISTNSPHGPSEILDNGRYGILIPVGNKNAMKEAIISLLADKNKYRFYAKKALERSRFFSEDKMLSSYKKLIMQLVKDKVATNPR